MGREDLADGGAVLAQVVQEGPPGLSHLSRPPKEGRGGARQTPGARGRANAKALRWDHACYI